MFKFGVAGAAAPILCATYAYKRSISKCDVSNAWPFDTKGMATSLQAPKTNDMLTLAGVGMRKKNFYITEVNVYMAGLNLNNNSLSLAKEWKKKGMSDSLTDTLLSPASKAKDETRAAMNLRFVRTVGTSSVTEAFNDAFKGLDVDKVKPFKDALNGILGTGGVKDGDELGFFWVNNDSLVITLNGKAGEVIIVPEVCKRLLAVYLDPKTTICKELVDSIGANLEKL
jgi:hypothetical protein